MLMVLMFGLECMGPCPVSAAELAQLEQQVLRSLSKLQMTVKPAPRDALRPTGTNAADAEADVARAYGVDRVVSLDLDPRGPVLWATWFAKGVVGPWRLSKIRCNVVARRPVCTGLDKALRRDAQPRQAAEVDVLGALRSAAPGVSRCVVAERRRPLAMRLFGRIELDLAIRSTGRVEVSAIAPARGATSELGKCLRQTMGRLDVGRFEGPNIRLRVPVDL